MGDRSAQWEPSAPEGPPPSLQPASRLPWLTAHVGCSLGVAASQPQALTPNLGLASSW